MSSPFRWPSLVQVVAVSWLLASSCAAQEGLLRILNDKREAFQARVDLIRQSARSIDVAYYAIDTDEVPVAILELLRQASLRGVHVRVMVDGFKSRLPAALENHLCRCGVEIRVYHPTSERHSKWLNRRMHTKMMVFDGEIAVVGSRNLENEYYEFERERKFIDCDAIVAGRVVDEATHYFNWLWSSRDVLPGGNRDSLGLDVLKYRPFGRSEWNEAWRDARSRSDLQRLLSQGLNTIVGGCGISLCSDNDWLGDAIPVQCMSLLHDCQTNKINDASLQSKIVGMLRCARRCVVIESPYPAFDDEIYEAILQTARRGVKVCLLTNSLRSTDQLSVYAAYQNRKRSLLRAGVDLREFRGRNTLHAKTMVIDNETFMIGSYNFDARSDNLNLEVCIVGRDIDGAAALRNNVAKRLAHADRLSNRSLLLPTGGEPAPRKRVQVALRRNFVELYRGSL